MKKEKGKIITPDKRIRMRMPGAHRIGQPVPIVVDQQALIDSFMKKAKHHTFLGLPMSKDFHPDFRASLWFSLMCRMPNVIGKMAVSGSFEEGTNTIIYDFLNKWADVTDYKPTHLFLMSADEYPLDMNKTLEKMHAVDADVVVGVCPIYLFTTGKAHWNVMHYVEEDIPDDKTDFIVFDRDKERGGLPDKPFRAHHSGGPYLIRREVLEKMEFPYFHDIFEADKRHLGQDLYFTAKAKRLGFKIMCEPRAVFDHNRVASYLRLLGYKDGEFENVQKRN